MNTQFGTDDQLAYTFSQQSYKDPTKRTSVGDWAYDPSLSNIDTGVWHNKKTKTSHVSNRGSQSLYDWTVSDGQIATGTEKRGKRFKRAVDTTRKAHDKYGYNVQTSGHSLGARVSAVATEELGNEDWYQGGTGFNQGNSSVANYFSKSRKECKSKNPPAYCAKQKNYKQEGDYVSQKNVACDILTFGFGSCAKSDPFGTTTTFNHPNRNRWIHQLTTNRITPLRMFSNAQTHSLDTFAPKS